MKASYLLLREYFDKVVPGLTLDQYDDNMFTLN